MLEDTQLVAKLRRDEQETGFQDAEVDGHGNGVEVLDLDCLHVLFVVLNRDLVQVSLFALQQEEERALPVRCSHYART